MKGTAQSSNFQREGLNITVPVFNEEQALDTNILRLREFVSSNLSLPWEIIIVDNGSTDGTERIGRRLGQELSWVGYHRLELKGRGRALRYAWQRSHAAFLTYTDVDLSTDLEEWPRLVWQLLHADNDLVIGSRLAPQSEVTRSLSRETISRAYNGIIRSCLSSSISDAQCGFKGLKRAVADRLLPWIQDEEWFFDTELLLLAEAYGYQVAQLPVRWQEDPDSRVRIFDTAIKDLRGLWRLFRHPAIKQHRQWKNQTVRVPPNLAAG